MEDKDKKDSFSSVTYSTRKPRFAPLGMPKTMTKSRHGMQMPAKIAGLVLVCLLVGFGGGWLGARQYNHNGTDLSSASRSVKAQYISTESDLVSQIAKDVGQSVVSVNVSSQSVQQDFFGFGQPVDQQSAGTGFIISSDGTIMTNRHVVPAGTTSVSVTLADGTTYNNVQVIGRSSDSSSLDVAFLKIGNLNGKKLVPVTLGDSSKVQVGDKVIAIGNALGQFQNTVTSGIISGYGRDVTAGDTAGSSSENLTDLFQTDAAINEGNSGGPLVDINGNVIGMNTAVAGNAQNIGFAIPVNDLKGSISSILGTGQLQQPYLGVRYVSITADIQSQFKLKASQGAYIVPSTDGQPSVIADSPAAKAGLKEGDIITKVDSVNISANTSLTSALSQFKVGQQVTLTVVRGGKSISVKVTLANTP